MSVTTKLIAFVAIVAAVFAGAIGVGRLFGPVDAPASADHEDMDMAEDTGEDMAGMDMEDMDMSAASDIPKGLMVSQNGYTFDLDQTTAAPGSSVPVSFTIVGPDGEPVTDYDLEHEKELHLIAVRRDFTGFQHVHPVMDSDGTWRTRVDLTSGQWRLFADFKATGADPVTLGNDLAVRGTYRPDLATTDSRTARVGPYEVTLEGDLAAGSEAKLTLSVTRKGEPVTDLEPYLGAYGHLVALRAGDLAYLHVHPEGTPDDGVTEPGPEVVFYAQVPSAGRYHLYLDFQHGGVVRTAAFTATASETAPSEESTGEEPEDTEETEEPHSGDEH
ncbi:hypothetical protein D0Z08_07355 [Nocardioides immobilis]|uniref:Heavy-metal-associated domain-containing protein n=1 Tax=Nocardioides immobilis TaxID=2049295 RepID=A0A417Y4B3_9ACTN|nr:hypothetical protein [Nocardioides immobilis]RHW27500.1 hypothetical protein D0Z08_07355 [Nocardioides immobilis]